MTAEWEECSLGDLIEIKHGFAFEGEFFREEPSADVLLTPGNFAIGGGFRSNKLKYYDGPVSPDFVLREGDLLVTMTDLSKTTDTLGYPAIVPRVPGGSRFLHNQRLGRVQIREGAPLEVRYLYYLLCSREYRNEVVASATGTTVKHTSPSRIGRFKFRRPPYAEQRAIAAILSTLDDKIELNRRMSETLEGIARALFASWFVDFDPHDEQSLIPEGWRPGRVGDEFNIVMGQSPPGETYNEDGRGLPFYQGRADFGFRFPTVRVYCTSPTRFADAGDTLVSVRAPVGDINMAAKRCGIGRGVAAVRHREGQRSYTYYSMGGLRDEFARFEAEGTVFGSINKADFHNLPIIVPPSDIVSRFERIVSPLDERIALNERESETLTSLRDTLLPKLLSGELRVWDAERVVGAAV